MSDDRPSSDTASMMRYDANKRSVLIAYILWFFLGGLGAHRFYLGATTSALILLALTVIGFILAFVVIAHSFSSFRQSGYLSTSS